MITDALLGVLGVLLGWLEGLLPEWEVSVPDGARLWVGRAKYLDAWIPASELIAVLVMGSALIVGVVGFKWAVKLVDWIADILP